MIDSTYNVHDNQVTPFVTYCRDNQIDYVNLDGLDAGTSPTNWVFGMNTVGVDSLNALQLEAFIDSLKTRGHVSQVGIVCYNSKYAASNVTLYDLGNFSNSVSMYNSELPWRKRVDVLSLDQEFWIDTLPSEAFSVQYARTVNDFHKVHMPFLKAMYSAARKCPTNYLRVEDYIGGPLNPYAADTLSSDIDTALYANKTASMEIDSIGKYADRILLSSYTEYPQVLWNRGDWIQVDSELGANRLNSYYKKEIWPIFDPANNSNHSCTICTDAFDQEDYLGKPMCDSGVNPTYMEQRYYGELNYSEQIQKWTNDGIAPSHWNSMGKDTNFQVWGCMWYEYSCLQNWKFDTNTHNIKTNIPFYVTLDHDTVWHGTPITLYANVHDAGGSPFLYYIWRNMDSAAKDSVLFSAINNNAYTINFPTRVGVEVVGLTYGDTLMATDYVNVFNNCYGYTAINYIKRPSLGVKIYPNPSNGMFTIEMLNNNGKPKNLYVYNMMGQELKSEELRENSSVIDLSGQPSGVYFCRIIDEGGNLLKASKIMIIH